MDAKLLKGMNEHLKLEFKASHEYRAMSVWLSANDLPGFATWMRQQSTDELMHAQKFIDHIVERDAKAVLPAVAQPPSSWKTVEALCAHVLQNEQAVTASINDLYAMAEAAKDRPAIVLLQWFVNEQMDESRPHQARRHDRCRPAHDRPGAGQGRDARHAGVARRGRRPVGPSPCRCGAGTRRPTAR
jgi:ferritin